ncbi:uncharacterized protein G2W53_028697 [Senna tora]|uniref:Uncharacterized protein n=1 Tax=Senna tora TaxID=362788 RepID=A0A834WB01_9FABA|nr:uncharacterized protein G2W53_028697 [Senna tora]
MSIESEIQKWIDESLFAMTMSLIQSRASRSGSERIRELSTFVIVSLGQRLE